MEIPAWNASGGPVNYTTLHPICQVLFFRQNTQKKSAPKSGFFSLLKKTDNWRRCGRLPQGQRQR
jgi:hypothetical protein